MRNLLIAACLLCLLVAASGCKERATVQGQGGRELTIVEPADVNITQGDIVEVKVRIMRESLGGPVKVTVTNLPAGVAAVDSGMNIVGSEGTLHLRANDDAALVANHQATVTATAEQGGIAVTVSLSVTVQAKEM